MTQRHFSVGPEGRDRPVEIEATKEMIEAGVDMLIDMTGDDYSNADRAMLIYGAMVGACRARA